MEKFKIDSESKIDSAKNGKPDLSAIIKNNPAGFIPRQKISEATGGLIHPRTLANLDSLGQGIPERFRVGRKICYPVWAVIRFIEERIEPVSG